MSKLHSYFFILFAAGIFISSAAAGTTGSEPGDARPLSLTVGKSLIIDSDTDILRVAIAGATLAETVALSPREILVNGLLPGETSLVIWEAGGTRVAYNLTVHPNTARLDAVRQQLATEIGQSDISLDFENDTAFLRGTVKDSIMAERAAAIAGTLGKVVNLLYVNVPPPEGQILLKVRFANVDRTASNQLGVDLVSTGNLITPGGTSTGQFTLSDALNLLMFRKTFNLSATLTALQTSNLLEILAEPNLLVINGQTASFIAGGEFPYPTVQGGTSAGAITISYREFGVRVKFLPNITSRGTIRLHVAPEVSSLDFANGLTFQGFHIPALATRKVETEVELESGQSFVIAGLLDNRATELLSKVPGIGDIPILGRLFQSRSRTQNNTELLIIVTPELVRPIPAGAPLPDVARPMGFLPSSPATALRNPGMEITGPMSDSQDPRTVPVEQLLKSKDKDRGANPASPQVQPASAPPTAPPPFDGPPR